MTVRGHCDLYWAFVSFLMVEGSEAVQVHYYFHLRFEDGSVVFDREGIDVADTSRLGPVIDAAIAELSDEEGNSGASWPGWTLQIVDALGTLVVEVRLSDYV